MGANTTKADGTPTKSFFISMLTRDIELNDAILDLLDNCLDGVMRIRGKNANIDDEKIYEGYEAHIDISRTSFCIWDNCGGIPRDKAINYAFKLGRSDDDAGDEFLPTVGTYGIGMKRAIFKIGQKALVCSKTRQDEYCVEIPLSWAKSADWGFVLKDGESSLQNEGTKILISNIHPNIASKWTGTDLESFILTLRELIKSHFSFIIEKGFSVYVNEKKVENRPIAIKFTQKEGVQPYIYKAQVEGVDVNMVIGFYRSIPTEEEAEDFVYDSRRSDEAGWTVICNDRVVLYNDKTFLTGWGENGVPKYHTQFIGIKGVVRFRSNDPRKLPMTTTKRGIDLNSLVYNMTKAKMRTALKIYTNYTNQWKGKEIIEKEKVSNSPDVIDIPIGDLLRPSGDIEARYGIKLKKIKNKTEAYHQPQLAAPEKNGPVKKVMRFSRPYDEIEEVATYLTDDSDALLKITVNEIGDQCFARVLLDARKSRG